MIQSTDVFCIGMNHRTAPVQIREKLALTSLERQRLFAHFRRAPEVEGIVLLSTCNRVELYVSLQGPYLDGGADRIKRVFAEAGFDLSSFEDHLYEYRGVDAAAHLADVAAGLDALVIGEAQILGQINEAFQEASELGTTDTHLDALFQFALKAGRRARAETKINHNPTSVSSVAVHLAERILGSLEGRTVGVVGLGEIGQLAIKVFRRSGVGRLLLVNRTSSRAQEKAKQINDVSDIAESYSIMEIETVLREADVVLAATRCPLPLIGSEQVQRAMKERPERPLVLLDMAVPQDVGSDVADIEGVRLFNVDLLQEEVDLSLQKRRAEIPRVKEILHNEVERFEVWLKQSQVQFLIAELRRQADTIRREEVERFSQRTQDLPPELREQVERFSMSLVQKLFHNPTTNIREKAIEGDAQEFAETISELFRLKAREEVSAE